MTNKLVRLTAALVSIAMLLATAALGQPADTTDPWHGWSFMMGKWVTDPGQTGGGTGNYSFARDLGGKLLVRHNHAEYPAANGRPASSHDDLMTVYHHPDGSTKAEYFDDEGHHITYSVTVIPDSSIVRMISDPPVQGPQFRLTYTSRAADSMNIVFDIAPSGKPGAFTQYLAGTAHRVE